MQRSKWMLSFAMVALVAACGSETSAQSRAAGLQDPQGRQAASAVIDEDGRSPLAFKPHSHPYGVSMEKWTERLWRWDYSIPSAQSPFLDLTGADCAVNQPGGPVWFVGPVLDPGAPATYTISCTIPHERALLFDLGSTVNDYPCPDPAFQPADGQSLYEFLLAGAQAAPNSVNRLSMTVDGVKLPHIFDYRETSDDLFTFTGDPSLAKSVDGCVTGQPQPAVSDGFFVMVKPLAPGKHTVVLGAADSKGTILTTTYDLTLQ